MFQTLTLLKRKLRIFGSLTVCLRGSLWEQCDVLFFYSQGLCRRDIQYLLYLSSSVSRLVRNQIVSAVGDAFMTIQVQFTLDFFMHFRALCLLLPGRDSAEEFPARLQKERYCA